MGGEVTEKPGLLPGWRLGLFLPQRWWPSGIPRLVAFCLKAPGVRFISLDMLATGVLLLECFLRVLSSWAVHSRRFARFAILAGAFAILPPQVRLVCLGATL